MALMEVKLNHYSILYIFLSTSSILAQFSRHPFTLIFSARSTWPISPFLSSFSLHFVDLGSSYFFPPFLSYTIFSTSFYSPCYIPLGSSSVCYHPSLRKVWNWIKSVLNPLHFLLDFFPFYAIFPMSFKKNSIGGVHDESLYSSRFSHSLS